MIQLVQTDIPFITSVKEGISRLILLYHVKEFIQRYWIWIVIG